ncbi:translocation/assembly module TamB domain-containing protein [Prolixibacter denitrificans]|uniref:Autotransporter translocation and assembly factor TamB n=1 Tax=Prolixibacter denitrificans TaxID=1541063 RepID=A0A2P8CEL4_9BACT|nr:translocation/assembly module TamB domain-containing protein [Prolixibacter denitrificans]PSK83319.1 autotransporter translocation and assembly factor TamB [Prolixibacter denitrificans]GET21798.1 hypothetical protein JCM18694_20440 [Prolixibacter denitrificans]
MVRRIINIVSWLVGGIIILILAVLLMLRTGMLNQWLASVVSSRGSEMLHAEVKLDSIRGNLLGNFYLKNFSLSRNDTILLAFQKLDVKYSLASVLRKNVNVDYVGLGQLRVLAVQERDSTWNLEHIFPADTTKVQPDSTSKSGSSWKVNISDFRLKDFQGTVVPIDTAAIIPRRLALSLALSFRFEPEDLALNLNQFHLQTQQPDAVIDSLTGKLEMVKRRLKWSDLHFQTTRSRMTSNGILPLDSLNLADLQLAFQPLDLADLQPFIKQPLYGKPNIQLLLKGGMQQNQMQLKVQEAQQRLALEGWFKDLRTNPQYNFHLNIDSINAATWTRDSTLNSLISGRFAVDGDGFDIKTNRVKLDGQLNDAHYSGYTVKNFSVNLDKRAGNVDARLNADAWLGKIESTAHLKELFTHPAYQINARLRHVDLADFLPKDSLKSDVNLDLRLKGSGMKLNDLKAQAEIRSNNTILLGQPVTDFHTRMRYNAGNYQLDSLLFEVPAFHLFAKGKGNIHLSNDFSLTVQARDINSLAKPLGLPPSKMTGTISGRIIGPADSLRFAGNIDLQHLRYDSITVGALAGNVQAVLQKSLYSGEADLQAGSMDINGIAMQSLGLKTQFKNGRLDNQVDLVMNDSLKANLAANVFFKNALRVDLKRLHLSLIHSEWNGGSDSTSIIPSGDSIVVRNLVLASAKQKIALDGRFAFHGNEDLNLSLDNVDLSQIPPFKGVPQNLKGIVSSGIRLTGSGTKPEIQGFLDIQKPALDTISLKQIAADVNFQDERLKLQLGVLGEKDSLLTAELDLPLHLSFADSIYLLRKTEPVHGYLRIDSLEIARFNRFIAQQGMKVGGLFSANVQLSNTIDDVKIGGHVHLDNGQFDDKEYGLSYRNIILRSGLQGNRFSIDTLGMKSGKGYLGMHGYVKLKSQLGAEPEYIHLNISGEKFSVANSDLLDAVINTNMLLEGTPQQPKFSGKLTVEEAHLNADALRARMAVKSNDPNPPLLVQAINDASVTDTTGKKQVTVNDTISAFQSVDFYRQLSGTFTVRIPGNFWIKGKDMNFELKGDLRAVKEGKPVDLFGTLNVQRGFYKMYGKRFDFESGSLTFTGSDEINPMVDFTIAYSFRDVEKQLRKITLHITGRALEPNFEFRLDGQQITEQDALSYILFGRSSNQLTSAQNSSVNSASGVAKNLALGQVSSVLKDALQSTLNLDVLEISGGESWSSSSVTVGKYITRNLYLGYQRTFALDKKTKIIAPEKITLEYQILRWLYLQATNQATNSGFDLIIKKSWK